MKGFFAATDYSPKRSPLTLIPQCSICKLHLQCSSPKMPVVGKGREEILVIGEAPGADEDQQNRPFVGKTGQLLQSTLRGFGIDLFTDCWVTNALRCRPSKTNQIKDLKSIEYCRPYAIQAIRELKPRTIILLGAVPVESVIGWLWKEDTGGIKVWAGWQIPCQRLNAWIHPTFHPSFIAREDNKGSNVPTMYFEKHLEAAVSKNKRPYKEVPDYKKQVKVILDPDEAAAQLVGFVKKGNPVAFDLETDRLKPDHKQSSIVSCAVSDGETTVSYPWHGKAVEMSKVLFQSELPKYGWNCKFESRWIKRVLGCWVRNWQWDGMLTAHAIDSRKRTKSLKFQAFVHLGQEDYDSSIKPYLQSDNSNTSNRIREANLSSVLLYNGMDALLTWLLAKKQMKMIGVE
jgi:uracil-DNA glycosylase family 4